jgi:glycosyltransferase involved in cell wall biosynthesis
MTRALRIGIAARALSLPYGGVREYLGATLRALMELGAPHQFFVYYADACHVGMAPGAAEVVLRAPHKGVWDHAVLPLRLAHDRPDVVWFPHNVSALGVRAPAVVSVMDLLYFPVPEFGGREYPWADTLYMRLMIPRSLRAARRIMTISDWTARDAERLLGIPRSAMRTIPLAPGVAAPPSRAECMRVRQVYGLARPYFLYAGTLSPRKNVRLLVEAFGRLKDELPHDLVLVGAPGDREQRIDDLLTRYGIAARVRRLGLVPRADLSALYGAADAFVFPSRYEGFGLPPLEAMACGCAVVCSNATALPEVTGEAALLFDPDDVEALVEHLRLLAHDRALRASLVSKGFAQAARFDYTRTAAAILALLEDAAG